MGTELERVDERQQARYRVLKNIYDAAGDSITGGCDITIAFAGAASDMDEGYGILDYLGEKGLISDSTAGRNVALSYHGIVEVEQSIMHPESPTGYFGPGMVQHFYAAVGVVQNTDESTAQVKQENEGVARALNADQQTVRARQGRRWRVLKKIYDKADGNVGNAVLWHRVKEEEGLGDEEWWAIWDYLTLGGFIKERHTGAVCLTRYGVERVERLLRNPNLTDAPSAPAGRYEQHFHAPVGAVQNAPGSTAYVTQNNAAGTSELLSLISELRSRLEALPGSEDALEQISDLEEEVQSPSPKKSRIKASLKYILEVVKDTGVNVLADAISKSAGL